MKTDKNCRGVLGGLAAETIVESCTHQKRKQNKVENQR
jgi:hypothetical protein